VFPCSYCIAYSTGAVVNSAGALVQYSGYGISTELIS
jgi:hypothetical protein